MRERLFCGRLVLVAVLWLAALLLVTRDGPVNSDEQPRPPRLSEFVHSNSL